MLFCYVYWRQEKHKQRGRKWVPVSNAHPAYCSQVDISCDLGKLWGVVDPEDREIRFIKRRARLPQQAIATKLFIFCHKRRQLCHVNRGDTSS